MKRIKYIFGILMLCGALVAHAGNTNQFTLVVDAGHGGHDTGAVGAISKEKNLTLKFALAFGRLVEQNCPDVKVVYTRKTDKFVELYRRADIANQNKADLFISIHINALPKGRVARGFQTYTLGTSKRTGKQTGVLQNLEVAKRENSVIFMEKDYKQTYHGYDPNSPESDIMFEFIQDKNMENSVELAKYMQKYVCQATGRQDMGAQQDNLAVLRLSSMPGALLELGFISTRDEEDFMNSANAESLYARGMFNAFLNYRKRHGGNITIPYMKMDDPVPEAPVAEAKVEPIEVKTVAEPAPEVVAPQPVPAQTQPAVSATPTDAPIFKVQILSSSSRLKATDARFKGLEHVDFYQDGGVYKYTVGASANYNEIYRLRKEVATKIPEAFIVAFKGGQRVDVNAAIREFKSKK
ncbi:N-acetylmuramoyl-L-alanine amidase [Prevotella sp. P6B1]|uniref:N-acetylmuramoyl-L-alanine amidase n=1 Tax=Prevotella sp. P6B1 TaxID=1410613 RepID=UPI001E3C3FC7|nr:N-acetylmuramoyl-L-alanine amidase [Prevotella sp. P6B1]